eukprot:Phypoly_transcript_15712.p1 GENE.Phypoly_transcript_15712~~Phypoly_transcript_15712.p1  ORF type:complete len:265 (+),score=34.03 Phypoly_transcript_15712:57-797(+)
MGVMQEVPINLVLGNTSQVGQKISSEREKITAHLQYVENLLRSATCASAERQKNLDNLRQYWQEGIFPKGEHSQENISRKPNFRDSKGTLCAVGYLVQHSSYGGKNLVNLITQKYQFSYIKDMDLPELVEWQEKSGLNLNELAMIQPTYGFLLIPGYRILSLLSELLNTRPGSEAEKLHLGEIDSLKDELVQNSHTGGWTENVPKLRRKVEEWQKQNGGKNAMVDSILGEVTEIISDEARAKRRGY